MPKLTEQEILREAAKIRGSRGHQAMRKKHTAKEIQEWRRRGGEANRRRWEKIKKK